MALNFTTREVGDVTVVKLDGRIVLGEESSSLRAKVKQLLSENRKKIVLNVEDVTFIDSSGNGESVRVHHLAILQGGLIKFCCLSRKLWETWQVTKLFGVFEIYNNEADAVKSFDVPPAYCLCPTCGQPSGPSLPRWSRRARWTEQSCTSPACGARFSLNDSESPSILRLSFQTYEKESFDILPGKPFKCQITGRLDLFSSNALEKCWLALPPPRRVVFDLSAATEVSDAGFSVLEAILKRKEHDAKASASLEGLNAAQIETFPDGAPFYRRMTDALTALGDVSDTPLWHARITVELPFSS